MSPLPTTKKCFHAQLALIEAEEQRQLAAKAAHLQAEEAATAEKLRLQAEADADAQARRKETPALLQRHEASSIEKLKYWHFEPNGDEATPEEQHREFMAKLVSRLVYTCNHLQSELANLQRAVRNRKTQHEDATRALDARVLGLEQAVPGPDAGASSSASSSRQLEQRVDHVVAMLGDISAFTEPATISQRFELLDTKISRQQQTDHSHNNSSARPYKMPTFQIEKLDDYTHQDPVVWWQGFTTELGIHEVPDHLFISALFINTKGGCQIWLSHMGTVHDVQVSDLYKKVSWEDMTKEWKKRFIVDDAPTLAVNRIFTMAQGSTPTRDWLTEWQKIVAMPDLLSFPHLRCEFYNRSCTALSLTLGDREQYNTFAEIINKARELIKTNRPAAHKKSTWQPTYMEKVRIVPAPLMDVGAEVVDLHAYIAQIDREFKTQRYDDIDAPLLYVRIQIGEATCSALIDCGASRNYISQDFMTIRNAGPLPRIDDLLGRLGGAQFLSKLDLKSGYHQLEIRKEDRYKSAFKTRYGHFKWLVMPFGLTNAPATFQAAMTTEFRHMLDRFVLIYLDDILVYSRSLDEHVEHLRSVLERLQQAKYKANRDKCEFAQQELEYLGHYVTPQGIRPLADKIEALRLSSDHPPASHYRIAMGTCSSTREARTYYVSHATVVFGLASSASIMIHDSPTISESAALLHDFDSDFDGLTSLPMSLGNATLAMFADAASPATAIPTAKDIVSDCDTRFMSAFWADLMQESDTTMKPSSARHPQTDGQTERAHQTTQMMLRTLIRPDQKDWVDRLPDIESAYNTSVHQAIGVTPFELHHGGRKDRIFADLLLPRPADIDAACSPASVRNYRELLTQAHANTQKAQVRMQQQANRRRVPCPIRAGDLVWVSAEEFALEQDVLRKLLPKWFGPWSVTAAAGDEPDGPSFVINIPEHLMVHPVFHASKLATYTPAKSDDFPDDDRWTLLWMAIRKLTTSSLMANTAASRGSTKSHSKHAIATTLGGFQAQI
ncbi:hypothetical protein CBR_g21292 [Chara braunii]|uniref:Integrase catalytic domain-containing protein n=1 Tax=Chara braunii TaxID=69332 RepID=A0A388L1E5_CHABU|nr:hypothetical protein CBR_g21292 [Chara braunii]|eukprot:GBG76052.1 hypothetical protein CBR_g21292 [Chara braunii]